MNLFNSKTIRKTATIAMLAAAILSLSACAGMSPREKNMAIGAGIGGAAGAVLTGGSTVGTLGGAAIGGIIGNQIK